VAEVISLTVTAAAVFVAVKNRDVLDAFLKPEKTVKPVADINDAGIGGNPGDKGKKPNAVPKGDASLNKRNKDTMEKAPDAEILPAANRPKSQGVHRVLGRNKTKAEDPEK
jgi:hypothetical protein